MGDVGAEDQEGRMREMSGKSRETERKTEKEREEERERENARGEASERSCQW